MKTLTLTLTENEAQALAGMLDAAVRHVGLRAAKEAAHLADKIQVALDADRKPADEPEIN